LRYFTFCVSAIVKWYPGPGMSLELHKLDNTYTGHYYIRGGMAQWVARHNVEVAGLSPIKGPRCFLEQETLPLLLSTGWFQEQIQA